LNEEFDLSPQYRIHAVDALEVPEPRTEYGQSILGVASSCLDISDGLVGDLTHICDQSDVSIELDLGSLPLSSAYQEYIKTNNLNSESISALNYALNGGDDYELAFTAAPENAARISKCANECGIRVTKVGRVIKRESGKVYLCRNGARLIIDSQDTKSFEHFS